MNIWDLEGRFWREHERAAFNKGAFYLYFRLIHEANKAFWKSPIVVSWNYLQKTLGISSDTLGRAISDLKSRNLITYKKANKTSSFWFPEENKLDNQTDYHLDNQSDVLGNSEISSNHFDNQSPNQSGNQSDDQSDRLPKPDNPSESEGPLRLKDFKILKQDLKEHAPSEKDGKPNYIQLIEKALRDQVKEPHRIIPVIIAQRDPSDYPFLLWLIKTTDLSKVKKPVAYFNSFFMDDQQSFEKRTQFQEMQGILQKARAAKAAREFEKVIADAH